MYEMMVDPDLKLREFTEEDAPALFRVIRDNKSHLRHGLQWVDRILKEEHALNYIRDTHQMQKNMEGVAYGIFKKRDLIGGIDMHNWDHSLQKAKMGYWLIKTEEGKGFMRECGTALINYCFDKLLINKLEIEFLTDNHRSNALAHHLGFKIEGILRDSILANGLLRDLVVCGLLRKEWNPASQIARV